MNARKFNTEPQRKNSDTFFRALMRPFQAVPENISQENKLAHSFRSGDDEPISSSNRLVGCHMSSLPDFDKE